jgi:DNA-binding SARP family transcriptional activator
MVEFRNLGPLEVTAAGSPVALGGPKPRALLAALLLRPGSVVSTDRLIGAVSGVAPPPGAVGALRAYASRLRAALPDGSQPLIYQAPDSLLQVGARDLDANESSDLMERARERAEAGDHGHAVELLDAALALRRGEALAEFDAADIDADGHFARLADLRLVAAEERADTLLHLGRGREVVPELETLVRAFPARELLSVLLTKALYAAGRQADALAVYRTLRRLLVEELGGKPAESTLAVHRQVLEQDPQLSLRSLGPTNLPRRATTFVNRTVELAEVSALIRTALLVTLTGAGGIGKSRLALEKARQARTQKHIVVRDDDAHPAPGGALSALSHVIHSHAHPFANIAVGRMRWAGHMSHSSGGKPPCAAA